MLDKLPVDHPRFLEFYRVFGLLLRSPLDHIPDGLIHFRFLACGYIYSDITGVSLEQALSEVLSLFNSFSTAIYNVMLDRLRSLSLGGIEE